jgi:hypothetical protein
MDRSDRQRTSSTNPWRVRKAEATRSEWIPSERFVSGPAAGIARAANGNKAVWRVAVCSLFSRFGACRQLKKLNIEKRKPMLTG